MALSVAKVGFFLTLCYSATALPDFKSKLPKLFEKINSISFDDIPDFIQHVSPLPQREPRCDPLGGDAMYEEVLLTSDEGVLYRNVTSTGCPNHYCYCTGMPGKGCGKYGEEGTQSKARHQVRLVQIPAEPKLQSNGGTSDVSCQLGPLGVAFNGVSLFGGAVDPACVQLNTSQPSGNASEWISFDCCSGHSQPFGVYHYHVVPHCLLAQLTEFSDGHSPQLGWSYDGFPVYGPKGRGGVMLQTCVENSTLTDCLDSCGGLEKELAGIDQYRYRYYTTGEVAGNSIPIDPISSMQYAPFIMSCYRGCTLDDLDGASGNCAEPDSGTVGDFEPAVTQGITEKSAITCQADD